MKSQMKKVLSMLLVVSMVFATMLVPAFADTTGTKITIVHTNDVHARVKEDSKSEQIGMAKISQYVKDLKAKGENVLLLDAGDVLHGQTLVTVPKGETAVEMMNLMGYNFMVPGNHDFNYGKERLLELSKKAKFTVLSANVVKEDGKPFLTPNAIIEVAGVKVGVFGLSTPETAVKTNPLNVVGLTFKDPVETAKAQVKELQGKGAQVIVALTHLGVDDESTGNRSYEVRDQVEGIDLIVDGHSHSKLEDIKQVEGKAQITSTGNYGQSLGVAEITINGKEKTVATKNVKYAEFAEVKADEQVVAAITKAEDAIKPLMGKVIGKTEVELNGVRENVRAGETNLSKIATDAIKAETGAEIALTNGGGVRESINVGDITMEEIISVFPFGNYVITLNVTGENLVKALEHGTSAYPEPAGSFPQVSGITYAIDLNAKAGERIKDVKVSGEAVKMDKTYLLATNDFMAVGGDGYTMLGESKKVNEYSGLDEMLVSYIGKMGTLTAENTKIEDRMTVIPAEVAAPLTKPAVEVKPEVAPESEVTKPEVKPETEKVTYKVKAGDVLWKIAKQFETTYQKIAETNKLKNANAIYPGQILIIQ